MVADVSTAWNIAIKDNDGFSTIAASAAFETMRLTWSLENQGGGSAEIGLSDTMVASNWSQPKRLVITGERSWGGTLTRVGRQGPPSQVGKTGKAGWKASALGLYNRLDYRIVRHDFVVDDNLDVIVAALLNEAQNNQYNGPMSFTMGATTGTPPVRLRTYCVGVNIGDAIRELQTIGGFDWEINAAGVLSVWATTRGVATGRTLTQNDCQEFEPTLDTSELLTNVTAIADPSDPFGPEYRMSRTAQAITYGRREATIETDVIADTDVNPDWEDELYHAGRALLKTDGGGLFTLRTVWPSNKAPWRLTDVWLDDTITVDLTGTPAAAVMGNTVTVLLSDVTVTLERMPQRPGGLAPVYWTECNWIGLITDLQITDGDPDQSATPELLAATRPHAVMTATPSATDYGTDTAPPDTQTPMTTPSGS